MDKPEIVIQWNDEDTAAQGWLVINTIINGVCGGGTFMHPYATEKEVTELARTMSYKNALLTVAVGGAKAGLRYDPKAPDATAVLERFLQYLKPWMETIWCTASDLNTSNATINSIIEHMGLDSLFAPLGKRLAYRSRSEDQSSKIYSRMNYEWSPYFTLSGGATGYSVARCIQALVMKKQPRIFVQGIGMVGRSLIYFIQQLNIGKIVGISDVDGFIFDSNGIDCQELLVEFRIHHNKNETMGQWLSAALKRKYNFQERNMQSDEEYVIQTMAKGEVDVFSPCAGRYVITEKIAQAIVKNHPGLYIISGANNAYAAETILRYALRNGIVCIPEWLSNCGNAILYLELLKVPYMPENSSFYFEEIIHRTIHSFLAESNYKSKDTSKWYDCFMHTDEQRMLRVNKREIESENITV